MLEWIEQIPTFINDFINYYQAQTLSTQILLGVIMILGFVAAGLIIAGAVWLTIQVIKATILGVILLAYIIGIGVAFIFISFKDPARIKPAWQEACDNMEFLANKFYPPKQKDQQGQVVAGVPSLTRQQYNQRTCAVAHVPVQVMTVEVAAPGSPSNQHVEELPYRGPKSSIPVKREVPPGFQEAPAPSIEEKPVEQKQQHFCTNCGSKFTSPMEKLLASIGKCYCESCGMDLMMKDREPAFE